jgi:hypothetical protein
MLSYYIWPIIWGGIEIHNISNPSEPERIGSFHDYGAYPSLFVKDEIIYAADMWEGLKLIDISDPTDPSLIYAYTDFGPISNVFVRDDIIFVSDAMISMSTKSFGILQLHSPTSITQIARYPLGRVRRIAFNDNYCYLAIADNGTKIMDFSDLTNIKDIFTTNTVVEPYDLQLINNRLLFMADFQGGLTVLLIDDPENPTSLSKIASANPGNKISLCVKGEYVYVTDLDQGLEIYKYESTITEISKTSNGKIGLEFWSILSSFILFVFIRIKIKKR